MRLSISDDDLCSTCGHLCYAPGELSACLEQQGERWPAKFNADGYSIRCGSYKEQPYRDWNWATNRVARDEI